MHLDPLGVCDAFPDPVEEVPVAGRVHGRGVNGALGKFLDTGTTYLRNTSIKITSSIIKFSLITYVAICPFSSDRFSVRIDRVRAPRGYGLDGGALVVHDALVTIRRHVVASATIGLKRDFYVNGKMHFFPWTLVHSSVPGQPKSTEIFNFMALCIMMYNNLPLLQSPHFLLTTSPFLSTS